MSKYHNAANVFKREANRFLELSETAKMLDEVGGLAQAADAEMARAGIYKKESDALKAEIAKLKASSDKIKADQAAKQKEADDIYAKTIHEANVSANDVMAKAKSTADKIVADAKADVQSKMQALSGQIGSLETAKSTLTEEVAALRKVADEANTEAEAAEKRLAKVRENIAKLAVA